jgi:hypothetical protein
MEKVMGRREVKAFALAPLPVVAPVLVLFGLMVFGAPRDAAAIFGPTMSMIAAIYGVTLLIGLPVHWLLQRTQRTALSAYLVLTVSVVFLLAAAFSIGNWLVPTFADGSPHSLRHMWSLYRVVMTLVCAALAALSASIFWCTAVMPQRSQ